MSVPRDHTQPLVSVIVPAYNAEATLRESVESILAQTHQALEVIIIDDGSTDATSTVIADLEKHDERVRSIRHPRNQGLVASRNDGIVHAVGDAISFLDADDLWLPEKLERQLPHLTPGVVVYCDFRIRLESPGTELKSFAAYDRFPKDTKKFDGCILPGILAQDFVQIGPPLMTIDDARTLGAFRNDFGGVEAWDFWIRAAERYRFTRIPEALVIIRRLPGSMNTQTDRVQMAGRAMLDDTAARLRAEGKMTSEIRGAVGLGYFSARSMRRAAVYLFGAAVRQPWRLRWWKWLCASLVWRIVRFRRRPLPGTGSLFKEPQ